MSSSISLLDEALRIGTQELDALRSGDVDLADQCFEERTTLMEEALRLRDTSNEILRGRLETLQELQNTLYAEAKKLKMDVQNSLVQSRKQGQRMRGYGLSVRQAQEL